MKKFFTGMTILISLGNTHAQDYSYFNVSEKNLTGLTEYMLRGTIIRKVSKVVVDNKEKFIATDTIVDYKSLAGDYQYSSDYTYGLCPIDISSYIDYKKDELVDYNTLSKTLYDLKLNTNFRQIELYRKVGTDIYIGDIGQLFTRIGTSIAEPGSKTTAERLTEYRALLKSKGYPTSEINGKIHITTKYGKVLASPEMYDNVQKGNFAYIDKVANSVNQYKVLSAQAKPYITKLGNHYSAHLNKTMTKARMVTWRADAKNAIAIFNKINALTGFDNTNFLDNIDYATVSSTTEFFRVVNGTRQVLGM